MHGDPYFLQSSIAPCLPPSYCIKSNRATLCELADNARLPTMDETNKVANQLP